MSQPDLKEIEKLLTGIIVFATKFKKEILVKAENLSEAKLKELKKVLEEVNVWQKPALQSIAKKDPQFYNRILVKRKQIEQEIINLYKARLSEEDNKKMQIILGKIKNI